MRPAERSAYSFRDDVRVPAFDDAGIVLVMDGDCALCSGAARRIARWDSAERVKIATAQSELGASLLEHYGFSPRDPSSWLMLEQGRARGSLDAIVAFFPRLRWWLWPMRVLRLLPRGLQDALYGLLARNRYRIAGKGDLCALPDAALRKRLIG